MNFILFCNEIIKNKKNINSLLLFVPLAKRVNLKNKEELEVLLKQNDLAIDNLTVKTSGDYDGDGIHEIYWKINDFRFRCINLEDWLGKCIT